MSTFAEHWLALSIFGLIALTILGTIIGSIADIARAAARNKPPIHFIGLLSVQGALERIADALEAQLTGDQRARFDELRRLAQYMACTSQMEGLTVTQTGGPLVEPTDMPT